MLNEMRFGMLSPETIQTFRSLDRPVEYSDGIEPNDLYAGVFDWGLTVLLINDTTASPSGRK